MDRYEHRRTLRRIAFAAVVFVALLGSGTAAFVMVGGESAEEAFYRAFGAFTTSSFYAEPDTGAERAIAAVLTVTGGVFYLLLLGGVVQALLRRAFADLYLERRMKSEIEQLSGHYVVCGYGRVGRAVVAALLRQEKQVVVVEQSDKNWDEVGRQPTFHSRLFLVKGDADPVNVLADAGLKDAAGLVACVGSDAENVYIALAARRCNDTIPVVVRASDEDAERNLSEAKDILNYAITPYRSAGDELVRAVIGGAI